MLYAIRIRRVACVAWRGGANYLIDFDVVVDVPCEYNRLAEWLGGTYCPANQHAASKYSSHHACLMREWLYKNTCQDHRPSRACEQRRAFQSVLHCVERQ